VTPRDSAPNRIPWPPILLLGAIGATLLLEWLLPTPTGVHPAVGAVFVAAALGLDGWAMFTMWRAKTNILPHRPADRLVTRGPFAYTRNPIYLGNVCLIVGIGLAVGSLWGLAAAAADALLTHRLAVLREERHLAERFGDPWRRYAGRTPRWVGVPRRP
jgi:protein-S-isoprenylcysteine O-methyltransferase Ste14